VKIAIESERIVRLLFSEGTYKQKYPNQVIKHLLPDVVLVTPLVFSSIIALHLHEHKHASFHVILCGCN
jgi:hypothetical protein